MDVGKLVFCSSRYGNLFNRRRFSLQIKFQYLPSAVFLLLSSRYCLRYLLSFMEVDSKNLTPRSVPHAIRFIGKVNSGLQSIKKAHFYVYPRKREHKSVVAHIGRYQSERQLPYTFPNREVPRYSCVSDKAGNKFLQVKNQSPRFG